MKQLFRFSLLLLAILLPALATAHDFEVDGIYYKINGNEATVTFKGRYCNSFYDEYSGSVVIPATVTYNETTYPVTSIDALAFFWCTEMTSIVIPNSLTEIGQEAFARCPGLANIVVESGNPRYDSRNNCNAIIETTDNTLIVGCKNTTIPNSVTAIGHFAFEGCTEMTSIVIPNSVTEIGFYAFESCTELTSVYIPNSVTEIGDWAFYFCSGLTSIDIPNSVTEIGYGAFDSCTGLTSINLGNSVTSIGDWAFDKCERLTSIDIPNSVTKIGDGAFYYCDGLTNIVIPNSVTSIGDSAFYDCWRLKDVYCYIADLSRVSSGDRLFYLSRLAYSGRTLHVLLGTANAYLADENWYPYFGQIVDDLKPDVLGDVNGDLEVNIADVNAVINQILSGNYTATGDVNGDGEVSIADVNAVIDIILDK